MWNTQADTILKEVKPNSTSLSWTSESLSTKEHYDKEEGKLTSQLNKPNKHGAAWLDNVAH